jgi:glutamate synthase (NADPH) small chain
MGNPRGFLDIKYKGPVYRDVKQRLHDYDEVEIFLSDDDIREQAARCMDCGIPFCHGCGCSLGNLIPEWNDLICQGFWKDALAILLSTNSFPEFTGRVCPAPCETSCTVGLNAEAVSIRQIEVALIEKGFAEGYLKPIAPEKRTGKKVAVVGSGPAGLAVADQLNKYGHQVTVFEREQYAGGLLRYGIPDFKLSKKIVQRRIDFMQEEGIIFETGICVGGDVTASYLNKRYDAICLACGAKAPRDLNVKGRELNGIHFAMDFLVQQNKEVSNEQIKKNRISAFDKKVVIIGGGDTGSDCVGTSIRQNAKSLIQLEIMPKPPEIRSPGTPWPEWPYQLRTSSSQKEGCERLWNVMTKSFEGENGVVKRINAVKVEWKLTEDGLPVSMKEIPGTEFVINADMILLSMGFTGPEKTDIFNQFEVEYTESGGIAVGGSGATRIKKVFAAGDIVTGASLVVRALDSGKQTAKKINEYLGEEKRIYIS